MRACSADAKRQRFGFTLIEMLIVMALILILASITVAFLPGAIEKQKSSRAADLLQGWLLVAKQWAKRDGLATGIRLQLPSGASGAGVRWVTDLQYIQQADDWTSPTAISIDVIPYPPPPGNQGPIGSGRLKSPPYSVTQPPFDKIAGPDFTGGFGPGSSPLLWPVQQDDYLELIDSGSLYRIAYVFGGDPTTSQSSYLQLYLILQQPPSTTAGDPVSPGFGGLPGTTSPSFTTSRYRVHRAPRILPGEPPLQMATGVAIDTNISALSTTGNYLDILFAPSGALLRPKLDDKVILCVRDVTLDNFQGDMTLITIYSRTGFIAAHALDATKTITCTALTIPPPPPPLQYVTLTMSDVSLIQPGIHIILDYDQDSRESRQVQGVDPSTNTIKLWTNTLTYPHSAPFSVLIDPFNFANDGRSSGL